MKIILDNISFKRGERFIFQHLDYGFHPGTFNILRGDSGSGKSTLLRIIAGFADLPFDGKVLIDGESQHEQSISKKVSNIGMVFQNPNQQFTMRTLRREITFALENLGYSYEEIQLRMTKAVELAQTTYFLDQDLINLSGGEKQRASLTVLLAMDAPVLLLDEPFASIDIHSRHELIQLLARLRDLGKTIILCDHDLSGYQGLVDQVVTLKNNKLSPENLNILDRQPTPELSKDHESKSSLLKLERISYGHGKRVLLEPTNYTFNQGITTLTGDNGVGKSTLLSAIVQQKKHKGRFYLNNNKIKKNKKLYQKVTLAVQDASHQFVQLTPREELSFNTVLSMEQEKKQKDMLEVLGLTEKLDGSLFHLSEGQKKMIQLISMLTLDRELLLLDEPFTGLDETACQLFMNWMMEKSVIQSFIVVSHRLAPLSGNSDFHVNLSHKTLSFVGETTQKGGLVREYSQNQYV